MRLFLYSLLGYLVGALPLAYLAGRLFAGADLRRTGTRQPGASNLALTPARWAVAPVGVAQVCQGALPPLVARSRRQPPAVQVAVGLASVVGQDWNAFLGFKGGRGMAHSIGFLLALSPPSLAGFAACGVIGKAFDQVPLSMLVGLSAAAPLAAAGQRPTAVVLGCALLAALAIAKRLLGADVPRPSGQPLSRTLALRLLFDRDLADRGAWLRYLQSAEQATSNSGP